MKSAIHGFSIIMLFVTFSQISHAGFIIAGDSFLTNQLIVEDQVAGSIRFRTCSSDLRKCAALKPKQFSSHLERKDFYSDQEIRMGHDDSLLLTVETGLANAAIVPASIGAGFGIGVLFGGSLVFLPAAYLLDATSAGALLFSTAGGVVSISAGPKNLVKQLNVIRSYDFSKIFMPEMSKSDLVLSFPDDTVEEIGNKILEILSRQN